MIKERPDEMIGMRFLYFIDRDFDPELKPELADILFETPCYSVENFYVTVTAFKKIVKGELMFSEMDED